MRRILLSLAALSLSGLAADASEVTVALDEVRTLTFEVPVTTVYVGNPAIADVNMIDSRHAFVLGKGYGTTNIIALNKQGGQISDTRVDVQGNRRQSTVVLNRGASRVTYSCTADHCDLTPQPGDGKDVFDGGNGQAAIHQDVAKKAAAGQ